MDVSPIDALLIWLAGIVIGVVAVLFYVSATRYAMDGVNRAMRDCRPMVMARN